MTYPSNIDTRQYLPDMGNTDDVSDRCAISDLLKLENPWFIFGVPDYGIKDEEELNRVFNKLHDSLRADRLYISAESYIGMLIKCKNTIAKSLKKDNQTVSSAQEKSQVESNQQRPQYEFAGNPYTFREMQKKDPTLPEPPLLIAANKMKRSYFDRKVALGLIAGCTAVAGAGVGVSVFTANPVVSSFFAAAFVVGLIAFAIAYYATKRHFQSKYENEVKQVQSEEQRQTNSVNIVETAANSGSPIYNTCGSETTRLTQALPYVKPNQNIALQA
ncbi:MAG: hypothetical protein ACK4PR_12570 [Gammaproteobacteria bacterium]